MKLAFTTLGCPEWDMDTIIANAVEYGYQGIDFRGYLDELNIYKTPEFSTKLEETKSKFQKASLEIPCFSSSVRLFTNSETEFEAYQTELEHYGVLCQHFNTPYIRVFGGGIGSTPRDAAMKTVNDHLQTYLKIAQKYDVTLLLETHDDWTNSDYPAQILKQVDSAHLQILWDVHHPYRTIGESPEYTLSNIGHAIRYTHWKDSYVTDQNKAGFQLCLIGEGDIPLKHMYQLLKKNNYEGYYTLEWEKKWWPDIEEPELAFKAYAEYMRQLENEE